jgi:hypothetical protein
VTVQQRRDLHQQQRHRRPRGLPPPLVQATAQLLDLAFRTVGEHTDRAHTDHDLASWDGRRGNFDPTPERG